MGKAALDLPGDLVEFLGNPDAAKRKLRYDAGACDCGKVSLLPLAKLKAVTVSVKAEEPEDSLLDPHGDEDGSYGAVVVNLVKTAEHVEPDFLLCWSVDLGLFASFDPEHGVMHIFPKVTWTQIVEDPTPYLNAASREVGECPGSRLKPWEHLAFRPGWYGDDE